jgi:hypothetical protein
MLPAIPRRSEWNPAVNFRGWRRRRGEFRFRFHGIAERLQKLADDLQGVKIANFYNYPLAANS